MSTDSLPRPPRIVFMGTPAFAVASLAALVDAGYHVVGVITAPDKPAGRGMKMHESAVKQYAVAQGLTVLQPEKLKNPAFLEELAALKADLQVVVAFRMLPELVWNMPPMGTINVHASLLPQYRGAAPINWAIINGEQQTGVTTFKLQHAIDTGNILMQAPLAIAPRETAGELHDRLMKLGAEVLVKTIAGMLNGTLHDQPQPADMGQLKHAPKLTTATGDINWHQSAQQIVQLVRGLSPFPGAFTSLHGKMLKLYQCHAAPKPAHDSHAPGTVLTDGKTMLGMVAADAVVYFETLQLEGKKRMEVTDFLRGYRAPQAST
ncbi:MAG: methionyl-tRNA formyltransferase [Chitinophagaceae bacterium]|nr:methionyl-tRNA formyltransferase [Chitinophagaceae bacterium]